MSKNSSNHFLFLSPILTIKSSHLDKRDVKNIKISLSHKMSATAFVVAAVLLILNLIMFFSMGVETNWNQVAKYGLASLLGQIISIVGTLCVGALEISSLKCKDAKVKYYLAHAAGTLMFVVLALDMFLSLYSDASMGFLNDSPTISASLTLISLLIIIQPVHWREAAILDGAVSIGLVVLSIYGANVYQMQGLMYYLFIAVVFPVGSYLIVSILFYAETQRYCEELRSEALHNTAIYDELTLCKNRYALKEALVGYTKRWENNKDGHLLVMMFDIDDFKRYNDQYSHIGGDYCLRAIADSIRNAFPAPTLDFYRYGGEEFLFFLETNSLFKARENIEKVRNTVKNLKIDAAKGAPCEYVTISVGATFVKTSEIDDFSIVIQHADQYLYQAKGSGKNVSVLDGKLLESKK